MQTTTETPAAFKAGWAFFRDEWEGDSGSALFRDNIERVAADRCFGDTIAQDDFVRGVFAAFRAGVGQ